MTALAFAVNPWRTILANGVEHRTPELRGLGDFLRRLGDSFRRVGQTEGTVIISQDVAVTLGWPATVKGKHKNLEDARTIGYKVNGDKLYPFLTFHSHPSLPDIHVGVIPWMLADADTYPLLVRDGRSIDPRKTIALIAQWQDESGIAYRGMPGLLAMAMLRKQWADKGKLEPKWHPKPAPVPFTCEQPLMRESWQSPYVDPTAIERLSMDANKAYLGTYIAGEQARYGLRNTGKLNFDPKLQGYWLCELEPWNDDRMPHPAGYGGSGATRWLTTPTVRLLAELTESGHYGGFRVLDSWTSRGARVMRPVGEKLSGIIHADGGSAPIKRTATMAFHMMHGLLTVPGGLIAREEWNAGCTGGFRSTIWRRTWNAGQAEGKWPAYFHVDAVIYPSDQVPTSRHFPHGARLGQFNPEKFKTLKAGDPL